ncbi:hypothetical protein PGTUg99_031757 [Puccinia graminis f. sp. tritici]|uniref:Uncharacterized protein n=1 Tax=Puccinia graminis f. sp. tritici TaxID=56615 RepID=A0A5B0RVD9_PUCGR|nr:hypothetical protein PGTUg99_031757 [Puccinia graminis f. sp. tritici]
MRLAETWVQATFVIIALVATLGFQTSRASMTAIGKGLQLGWKIGLHIPPGVEVDTKQLGAIMKDAVVQNPDLLKDDDQFSARVKEECFKLGVANHPACGHDQSSTSKGKKGAKVVPDV